MLSKCYSELWLLLSFFSVSRKLTGMAFRVPVPDVSVVDLTVRLKTAVRAFAFC